MKPAILCLLLALLVGCDTLSGVSRHAEVSQIPDLEALVAMLKSYPEIDTITIRENNSGRSPTSTGFQPSSQSYTLFYEGQESIEGILSFYLNEEGEVCYLQSRMTMGKRISPEALAATLPIMQRIERDLENQFGLRGLVERIEVEYVRAQEPEVK